MLLKYNIYSLIVFYTFIRNAHVVVRKGDLLLQMTGIIELLRRCLYNIYIYKYIIGGVFSTYHYLIMQSLKYRKIRLLYNSYILLDG